MHIKDSRFFYNLLTKSCKHEDMYFIWLRCKAMIKKGLKIYVQQDDIETWLIMLVMLKNYILLCHDIFRAAGWWYPAKQE